MKELDDPKGFDLISIFFDRPYSPQRRLGLLVKTPGKGQWNVWILNTLSSIKLR